MNTYIARQPILNANISIYAYELLYRNKADDISFGDVDPDHASSRIVLESFHTMGLEAITGGKRAFINFTPNLLAGNFATFFPKDRLVIEIQENVEPSPALVQICRDLASRGYTFALDNFIYRPELNPLIELADILKIDFLANSSEEIAQMIKGMGPMAKGKKFLAEKVETVEDFRAALSIGFTLFQGYFFSKPITVTARGIVPLKANYLRLLKEVYASQEVDSEKLAEIIHDDIALAYNLLKLINSAFYGLRTHVTSIRHALTVLGSREVRKWVSLMAMIGLNNDKPEELIKMSMIRAAFMEQLGESRLLSGHAESIFLTGLFSLIDVLVDQPKEVALSGMEMMPDIEEALLKGTGQAYDMLCLAISLERGDWREADRLAALFGVGVNQVMAVYLSSVKWCDGILGPGPMA